MLADSPDHLPSGTLTAMFTDIVESTRLKGVMAQRRRGGGMRPTEPQ